MELEEDGDLVIKQEGANVRAVADRLDILFPKSARDAIIAAYNEWRPRVMAYFEPRFRKQAGANIAEVDLRGIIREITLHWIGYYVMHREATQMGEAEWDHPQTRRIIRASVERVFARGSAEATTACARLMGITHEAYQKWAEADDDFLGLM